MTTQNGQLEGNEKTENTVMQNNEIDCYQQNLTESLEFVNEMKSAVLEDWRKTRHDYFMIESRKKDLEKMLQSLLEQEDKAGAFFIPSEHNENKKEQDLIQEELQLVEEQQKKKQEILEQKEQRAEKMDQLYQCLKSYGSLLDQMEKERDYESDKSEEEAILENSINTEEENRGIPEENITDYNSKEDISEENISEKNIFIESVISEERNIEKIAGTKIENSLENGEATALLAMQEYERKRIAREMHDSTIQDLTTLIHRIEFIEKLIDMDIVRAKMELSTLKDIVKKSVDETRNIIYDLHPVQIEEFGLKAILQKFVARIEDEYKISINLSAEDDQCKDCAVNLALYRIIQEACNNAIRYSEATQIVIELSYTENQIHLAIEDNGLGFDMEEVQRRAMSEGRGFGLSVMKERVYLLSGKFDISSASGAGTKITVIIPRLV